MEQGQPVYRGMDARALDAAYNNAAAVAGSAKIVEGWRQRSATVRADPAARLDLPYGDRPRTKLDYFPAADASAPLFMFIHGGYWQMREKETFALFAEGPRARGFAVALAGYTLAPEARLRQIVAEVGDALTYLSVNAGELGFDADRIHVGGWSAGGHLTAMMLDHPAVKGGLAISGLYDLEPIALTYLDKALRLDDEEIADLSPIRRLGPGLAPVHVCVGGNELSELRRQSEDYAAAAEKAGVPVSFAMLEGCDHFSILGELADPDGALTEALVGLAGEK